ncbi:MAG TPA: [FeFe] hydrogenase H-cluster maturation GTPase HydF [Clostridiaceae bacterium]|jgi:[FeFe] hydrogenase H-cluster maturation GTPase HydF|nr:[FeFe] hydrogenase H-cluster maturation GTPase HydF [Clostridiaceae bacterium]
MNKVPLSQCVHISIFGNTNVGKSSLINCITGQDVSIVSPTKGTTTDPVYKTMELIPVGPCVFIDTAGLDDKSELGLLRIKKTNKVLSKTDIAIYVMDINDINKQGYEDAKFNFKKFNVPFITVINKADTVSKQKLMKAKSELKNVLFVSSKTGEGVSFLKEELIKRIKENQEDEFLIKGIVPYGGKVVMVIPIDSEAPKGRLILPQVQLLRECLDNGIKSYVVRDTELESAILDLKDIDLVVTDSQAFKKVEKIIPKDMRITSFSILLARAKGDMDEYIKGVNTIENLPDGSKILIAECCTHNTSHEDIARVKIPMGLKKKTGKNFNFQYCVGQDFPENLKDYSLIIQCGACMVNKKTVQTRIMMAKDANIPITNYGIVLAYISGILDRAFKK